MRVSVLGPLTLIDGEGHPLDIKGAKILSALVALLFQHRVSDEALTAYLWGESPPTTARAQVYTYVSRLRAILGDAAPIDRQGSSYRLDRTGVWLDADVFTSLARRGHQELVDGDLVAAETTLTEALDLWRGCALAEVTPELRDLIVPSLEHVRLLAAEDLGEAILGLGHQQVHLPTLERFVRENPTHEPLSVQLMQALHRSGRRGEALQAFHRLEDCLREELGLDPSDHVQTLHLSLVRGEDAEVLPRPQRVVAPPVQVQPAPDVQSHVPPHPVRVPEPLGVASPLPSTPALFGPNGPDLGALCRRISALRLAQPHRPACLVVTGMPGLGKATVAVAIAQAWPEDTRARVLARLVDDDHEPVPSHRVMEDILSVMGEPAPTPGRYEVERHYRAVMAERPVVLILEDAASGQQIATLSVLHPGSLVIVTGHRMLVAPEVSVRIHRRPLTPEQSRAFLLRSLGSQFTDSLAGESGQRLVEACGGIPALLDAVATRLGDPGMTPARLWSQLVDEELRKVEFEKVNGLPLRLAREQVATLTHNEVLVLRAALRQGCPFSVARLKEALGWRRSSTHSVLRELQRLGLVSRTPSGPEGTWWTVSWLLQGVTRDVFDDAVVRKAVDL